MVQVIKNPPTVQEMQRLEDILEEEWQLATVSLPEKSMDRESWQATVHQVPNSQTWLSTSGYDCHTTAAFSSHNTYKAIFNTLGQL